MFAQMSEHQRLQASIQTVENELRDHVVRQVPVTAHNALLYRPGIRPHLQHFDVVIGFQQQELGPAQVELHRIRACSPRSVTIPTRAPSA